MPLGVFSPNADFAFVAESRGFYYQERRPPISTLFPDTTLFRSRGRDTSAPFRDLRSRFGRSFRRPARDRESTRLNSSFANISYVVFCLKKKNNLETIKCLNQPNQIKTRVLRR